MGASNIFPLFSDFHNLTAKCLGDKTIYIVYVACEKDKF